jgi:RNA polymerase sigma-B factor
MSQHEEAVTSTSREHSRALFAQLAAAHSSVIDRSRARGELVELHLPLVEHCARRFVNRGEPLEDLVQVGTIGLIKAVDRYDAERGVEFSTYAVPTILGEIKRHFRDKGWAIRVPRRLQELRMSIAAATSELSQRLGRSPTPTELADRLGVPVDDVLDGMESANAYATLSLDAPAGHEDGIGSILDLMGAADEALHHVEIRESIRPLIESLPPRERQIVMLRFFRQMTQSQIAEEVGISQMHVSRLLARTLAELRDSIG